MPVNGVSVGVDYQFGLYDPNTGGMVDLGIIENVKITARKHDIKAQPYNDVPRFGYIEDGYAISFSLQRTSSKLENIGLQLATAFNTGKSIQSGYFLETVTDADGSVHRYRYDGFVFHLTEVADVSREKTVKQTVEAMASSKVSIA